MKATERWLIWSRSRTFGTLREDLEIMRRCVRQMAQDGLDIDDPTTHPTWTGKVTIGGVTHDVAEVVAERDRMRARVAELEAALRGLVEAAQVLASSHTEMHDNAILLETVDDPADRAICAARAALVETATFARGTEASHG